MALIGGGNAGGPARRAAPGTIDWATLLRGDPQLRAALQQINTAGVADTAALTAARQRALVGFGGIPEGVGGADITDTVRQLAGQNTQAGLSTLAGLQHAYDLAQSGTVGSLIGRGLLRSGAYRQHSLENLRGLQTGTYQAQQGLLDTLAGYQKDYRAQQADLANQAATATNTALQGIIGNVNAGAYGSPPQAAPTRPATSSVPPVAPKPMAAPYRIGPAAVARNAL